MIDESGRKAVGFEWDENKNDANIRNHGIDFIDAARVLLGINVDVPSKRNEENRRKATGLLNGKFVTVVYTMRDGNHRIISARRAWKNEQRAYRQTFG